MPWNDAEPVGFEDHDRRAIADAGGKSANPGKIGAAIRGAARRIERAVAIGNSIGDKDGKLPLGGGAVDEVAGREAEEKAARARPADRQDERPPEAKPAAPKQDGKGPKLRPSREIEAEIADVEAEMAEIARTMAARDVASDPAKLLPLAKAHDHASARLEALMDEWEASVAASQT